MKDAGLLLLIKTLVWPFSKLPPTALHLLGKYLGKAAYYLHTHQRKRVLSNLANAPALNLDNDEIKVVTKQAFQNLYISTFEYLGIQSIRKHLDSVASCDNPEQLFELRDKHPGIILVACHQANWEMAFIQGTAQLAGAVVGQAFPNEVLHNWSLSIREVDKGLFIESRNAILKGMKFLKAGTPVGIAVDQPLPSSPYAYPFLGTNTFISPTPGIWAYRTQCPILIVTTRREGKRYITRFSEPIWANTQNKDSEEVTQIMDTICQQLEDSIKQNPGQYLWQHNRMQQHHRNNLKKMYRHDVILIVLPEQTELCDSLFLELQQILPKLFPRAFITILAPHKLEAHQENTFEMQVYKNKEDLLIHTFKYQMVLAFDHYQSLKKHFLKLATFKVVDCSECNKQPEKTPAILEKILCA